jgi:hypothetical protein
LGRSNCGGGQSADGFACLFQPQLQRGLVARVAADDGSLGIDYDGLAKPKLLDRRCHRVYSGIVLAGIARVRFGVGESP